VLEADGAKFSVVAVVPTDKVEVLENGDKLAVVDTSALIQRKACKVCGVHLYGPVEKPAHPSRACPSSTRNCSPKKAADGPTFAAFVSSIIEVGAAKPKRWTPCAPA